MPGDAALLLGDLDAAIVRFTRAGTGADEVRRSINEVFFTAGTLDALLGRPSSGTDGGALSTVSLLFLRGLPVHRLTFAREGEVRWTKPSGFAPFLGGRHDQYAADKVRRYIVSRAVLDTFKRSRVCLAAAVEAEEMHPSGDDLSNTRSTI